MRVMAVILEEEEIDVSVGIDLLLTRAETIAFTSAAT